MPRDLSITITGIDPADPTKLTLNPPSPEADRGQSITWLIGTDSVSSFKIKKKHDSPINIFTHEPPDVYGRKLQKNVRLDSPNGKYKYSIFWKATQTGPPIEFDPIISINSDFKRKKEHFSITGLIALVSLLTIALLFWPKNKKV